MGENYPKKEDPENIGDRARRDFNRLVNTPHEDIWKELDASIQIDPEELEGLVGEGDKEDPKGEDDAK